MNLINPPNICSSCRHVWRTTSPWPSQVQGNAAAINPRRDPVAGEPERPVPAVSSAVGHHPEPVVPASRSSGSGEGERK